MNCAKAAEAFILTGIAILIVWAILFPLVFLSR